MNWENAQPIETCPKDWREFLAYDPVAKKFDVCEWDRHFLEPKSTQSDGTHGPGNDDFLPERATLWWPLPEAK